MNTSQIGAVLRMLGPLFQIALLSLLVKRGREGTILGVRADYIIWGGFLAGCGLTLLGILLCRSKPTARTYDSIDRPLNL